MTYPEGAYAMPVVQSGTVARHLRRLVGYQRDRQLDDGQLLSRFVTRGEEEAVATLVARPGPLVLGVCRRILPREQAAEHPFQATSLVVARRAASLRCTEALGSWLYRVASRIATKAGVDMARRKTRKSQPAPVPRRVDSPGAE